MHIKEYGGYNVFSSDREIKNDIFSKRNLYSLNLARNGLELLLRARKAECVHAPYYTCHSIHKVLENNVPEIRYYHIDEEFFPVVSDDEVGDDHIFLINNYFGVFDRPVNTFIKKYGSRVIVDNSQGFYSKFPDNIDQILSPRKFFGVTDGGLLITEKDIMALYRPLDVDMSAERIKHLFMSDESSKDACYKEYLEYRNSIQVLEPMKMSVTTRVLLNTIDIDYCKNKRIGNYNRMSQILGKYNSLNIPEVSGLAPMCYPFLARRKILKKHLVERGVYVGTYWPLLSSTKSESSFEALLRGDLCCLPIDQGMDIDDVDYVAKLVISLL